VRGADNFTSFMRRFSVNLGASASWNPLGLYVFVEWILLA